MEDILNYTCLHADKAHWVLFILILMSGLSLPVSEDIVLIVAGIVAATCIPNETLFLFLWMYAAVIIGGWETYWLGRLLGPKLYNIPWFRWLITPRKIEVLHQYYERYGVLIFMVVRFCPGIRLVFYISAGLGKMPFPKLVIRDAFAAAISVPTIFGIGYYFGANYKTILYYIERYNHVTIAALFGLATLGIYYAWRNRNQ